jgi:undecaprenyl-diphosphatase
MSPAFQAYAKQVVANCKCLAAELAARGFRIVSGGTDNHVMLVDLRPKGVSGRDAADAMDVAAQGYSFPSGHSASAVAAYGSLAAHEKKRKLLWVLAFLLPLLVGFSRVFVGAHYPTDVLFGWLLGLVIVMVIPLLRRKIKNRWVFYALLLLTAVPGFFYCTSNDYYSSFGMLVGFILAEPFEEKFVNFGNTSNVLRCILRTLGGALLYFGLNEALKMPFPKELLEAGDFTAHLIRALRYAVVIFVLIGVYPMLFKVTGKLWERKPKA